MASRGRTPTDWTPERLATLREARAAGLSLIAAAERVGVSLETARRKELELGLPKRRRLSRPGAGATAARAAGRDREDLQERGVRAVATRPAGPSSAGRA